MIVARTGRSARVAGRSVKAGLAVGVGGELWVEMEVRPFGPFGPFGGEWVGVLGVVESAEVVEEVDADEVVDVIVGRWGGGLVLSSSFYFSYLHKRMLRQFNLG